MGVAKKTRKFGQVKRMIGQRDARLKANKEKAELDAKTKAKKTAGGELVREAPQMPSNMFFQHNTALVPPYNVLVDTNFLSHTVQRKLSLLESMMDCLYAKCNPIITSCVMAELEKLGPKYRLALRVARDERWQRLECDHKGVYADDCLVDRVSKNRIYIVGTNDKALKQRLRKIPGVPLMSVARGKYAAAAHPPVIAKRTRVLLSCGPCRASKLKCDRLQPCSQCAKKSRPEQCVYAPRPVKKRPPRRGMSARLQRLEGMVRNMMDEGGEPRPAPEAAGDTPAVKGNVVHGGKGTTYVGATHCMAMLEDIQDLKTYFQDETEDDEDASPTDELDAPEMLLWSPGGPGDRDELLAQLPERHVADRLITRYFSAMSPSQHIVHRPTFTRAYARFWQDPNSASLHWIALLYMVLALGVFFNNFAAPHELSADSPLPVHDRIKQYRSCAGWALIWGKYTQPSFETLSAFLLYVESHFMFNRAAQMNCYVLSGVSLRLMFKMGLHRDPSRLADISPFEGEMRRRMWNMAVQIESIVAFHMGLPSLLQGVESDTEVPRNLQDDDFDEDSAVLPPGRPDTDHTIMTYPINKTKIVRVFGQIARLAHALTPPTYAEVRRIDSLLQQKWKELPAFMRLKPLEECIGDSPHLMIQRFGLAAVYNKCRCVLHRPFIAELALNPEHDYSRQQCFDGALSLLNYQQVIWRSSKPGNVLSQNAWFLSSLAIHDFLLAAVILYMVIRHDGYNPKTKSHWVKDDQPMPSKDELRYMIRRSHAIWSEVATEREELRKTADTLATILAKLGTPVDRHASLSVDAAYPPAGGSGSIEPFNWGLAGAQSSTHSISGSELLSSLDSVSGSGSGSGPSPFAVDQRVNEPSNMDFAGAAPVSGELQTSPQFDVPWMSADTMDWRYLDISLAHSHTAGAAAESGSGQTWIERLPLDDLDMMGPAGWNQQSGGGQL
ncbi:C6 transcription factor [Purpureocillium lavendulum]|uniref:C6 transcription factor n=1 Tax=Purpureocillium lavendulum TaxID=1247861 RepID=A0AB34FGF1_9HYPO|nr:C6 transcription factor [Purpureocillium lavendulum]